MGYMWGIYKVYMGCIYGVYIRYIWGVYMGCVYGVYIAPKVAAASLLALFSGTL